MDLQKEREAFEAWFESRYDAHFMQFALDLDMYADKHTQTCWEAWQAAKANPKGFMVVPRKSIEHWYLDEGESLWMDEPDNWLCDMDVGDVQEVKHKEYIVTESNTLYATKVWDGENQDVSSWEFFNSKDDAEKAAEYCKAMIEA